MEVGMSLNALVPLSTSRKHSLFSTRSSDKHQQQRRKPHVSLVVEAKGKRGMQERQFKRPSPPPMPKVEDDGNPKFVIFIRMANVYLWYPLSLITGGTTAKIMVSAKDNFLGKYIYKDTIARNIAAVVYKENNNLRAALSTTNVIELPPKEELKTVFDKVKDFFGDAKESFGKLTTLDPTSEEPEIKTVEKPKA
ncbi:hypothetical protein GIB67_018806 [Kingdonia uniflora]|uniref:Protein HHL1, chloroplastic n=1 Tax=Kingdonia uniflora TaxID=39325 RepID=A0A7J7NEG1_9MAGN|nr:hypothetical protein GIB67_018806 [Kingdonia uniflora]